MRLVCQTSWSTTRVPITYRWKKKTILTSFDHLFLCFQNFKGNLIDLFRIFVSATTPVGKEWWIVRFLKLLKICSIPSIQPPLPKDKQVFIVQKYKSSKVKYSCRSTWISWATSSPLGSSSQLWRWVIFIVFLFSSPQDRGSGHIVNISSDSERVAFPGLQFCSSLSKCCWQMYSN